MASRTLPLCSTHTGSTKQDRQEICWSDAPFNGIMTLVQLLDTYEFTSSSQSRSRVTFGDIAFGGM
eukprot:scaffold601_cov146-Skeletonema_menzelii.AAC.6